MIMTTTMMMTKYCNCCCCHKNCKTMMNSVVHSIFSIQQYVGAFYSIRLLKETFAPETPQTDRLAGANWTPGCWSGVGSGTSQEDVHTDEIPEVSDDIVADFNEGMAKIARQKGKTSRH